MVTTQRERKEKKKRGKKPLHKFLKQCRANLKYILAQNLLWLKWALSGASKNLVYKKQNTNPSIAQLSQIGISK